MNEAPITYQGVVYPWHCDHMGHMNVMWYTGKFDEATWHLFSMFGLTRKFLDEEKRGMAAIEQVTKYLKEALPGDTIVIRTHMLEVGKKTVRFVHEMFDTATGKPVATSEIVTVFMDTKKRKSVTLSDEMREKAEKLKRRN